MKNLLNNRNFFYEAFFVLIFNLGELYSPYAESLKLEITKIKQRNIAT